MNPTRKLLGLLTCLLPCMLLPVAGALQAQDPFPVAITVDASESLGELPPVWRFFGADEPNYATMPHGRKLLGELGALRPDHVFFRAHNLLTTGDGTPDLKWGSTNAYTEDPQGNPVYDWKLLDGIFDAYRAAGVRPYAQIGFMPQALSTRPEPYRHHWRPGAPYDQIYTGWAYPPKDYAKWAELVHQWVKHCVERYGRDEVATWWWETWNEPNIGYWRGTPEEFHKLHDYAVDAVRRALPEARVGGPDVAGPGGGFARGFYEHCLRGTNHATGRRGTPLDFVSFHAKGRPETVDGHVRMGIAFQLRDIDEGFRTVASYPELKQTPIVIGESDPEGCAACQGPALAYRNGTMYSSYTAASFARKLDLARRHGVNFEGALTWAFEFEGQPLFAGFRSLATGGIDKPVLNVFRMFSRMGPERIAAQSDHAADLDAVLRDGVRSRPDVGALASRDAEGSVAVLAWHYHDDDVPGPAARVGLKLTGLGEGPRRVTRYLVDHDHGNAYTAWLAMGSPQEPTDAQRGELERRGALATVERGAPLAVEHGAATLTLDLPRQGVTLVVVE